jgi:cryptochrome
MLIYFTQKYSIYRFLTRTGLWASWEVGLAHFLKYLLDADWSVCAGNWMWVSSSAFERLLDSSKFSIIGIAFRLDPNGEYVRRYIPELRDMPDRFIHEPWKAPLEIQRSARCIVGADYPEPMIDLARAMQVNSSRMREIRNSMIEEKQPHVRPSNEDEIRTFFWIADDVAVKC